MRIILLLTTILYLSGAFLIFRVHKTSGPGFGCYPNSCFVEKNAALLPREVFVYDRGGYDGQFYYYIAAGLYTGRDFVVDSESFRLARIGLPILSGWTVLFYKDALFYTIPLIVFLFHLAGIVCIKNIYNNTGLTYIFALNPFSFLSFQLYLADGLAWSLALIAFFFYKRVKANAATDFSLYVFFALLSILTKETMILFFISITVWKILDVTRDNVRANLSLHPFTKVFVPFVLILILPFAYYHVIGFTPGSVSSHGTFPFTGWIGYLSKSDSIFSGRSFLSLLLLASLFFSIYAGTKLLLTLIHSIQIVRNESQIYRGYAFWRNVQYTFYNDPRTKKFLSVEGILFMGGIAFVSLATAEEYWANFANIARIFIPLYFAMILLLRNSRVRFALYAWSLLLCLLLIGRAFTPPPGSIRILP